MRKSSAKQAAKAQTHQPSTGLRAGKPEVAELFNVSVRTVEDWMARHKLPYLKIGGTVRFDLEMVKQHVLSTCTVEASNG